MVTLTNYVQDLFCTIQLNSYYNPIIQLMHSFNTLANRKALQI